MRVFWFHYNKPASVKAGRPQITIHYKKACHVVDNLVCNVVTQGHIRKGEQPNFVIKGKCRGFEIKDQVAYIS